MEKYPNLIVTAIIEYNNKFLLIKRASKEENYSSFWAFPGGKADIGETAIETLRREVFEEVGLELLDEAQMLNSYVFKSSIGIAFLVRAKDNNIVISDEIDKYIWIENLKDMKKYKCIPGIYNHLDTAIKILKENRFNSLDTMHLVKPKYLNKS